MQKDPHHAYRVAWGEDADTKNTLDALLQGPRFGTAVDELGQIHTEAQMKQRQLGGRALNQNSLMECL